MSIIIKTPEEIEKMRVAGRLAAEVLEMIEPHVRPGITTIELDQICHEHIVNRRARPLDAVVFVFGAAGIVAPAVADDQHVWSVFQYCFSFCHNKGAFQAPVIKTRQCLV